VESGDINLFFAPKGCNDFHSADFCETHVQEFPVDMSCAEFYPERTQYVDNAGKKLTLRRLMSYVYGAPILDVSRSHTTTQHSR